MNNLNTILLSGTVCFEPKVVLTSQKTNKSLVCIRLASNRFYQDSNKAKVQESLFIDVEAWGKLGEHIIKYVTKGMNVRVVGRLRMSTWKDENEKLNQKLSIVAEHVEFVRKYKAKDEEKILEEDMSFDAEKADAVMESGVIYSY